MDVPFRSIDPVNEFDESTCVFANAFPWLFPGGTGDLYSFRGTKVDRRKWLLKLMLFEDGRFVKDNLFSFFAMNFIARKESHEQGGYYVNTFYRNGNGPEDLTELKTQIEQGDTSWISNLMYFSKNAKGSASFWREKRSEVISWINYHIKEQHGAPNLFLTFSCAEYYWPDIKHLMEERRIYGGNSVNGMLK